MTKDKKHGSSYFSLNSSSDINGFLADAGLEGSRLERVQFTRDGFGFGPDLQVLTDGEVLIHFDSDDFLGILIEGGMYNRISLSLNEHECGFLMDQRREDSIDGTEFFSPAIGKTVSRVEYLGIDGRFVHCLKISFTDGTCLRFLRHGEDSFRIRYD